MIKNIFFKKKNIKISQLFPKTSFTKDFIINDIKPLHKANKNELTRSKMLLRGFKKPKRESPSSAWGINNSFINNIGPV